MYDPSALTVSVPYVPVNACPIVPEVPEPLSEPVLMAVIVNDPDHLQLQPLEQVLKVAQVLQVQLGKH